MNTPSTGGNAQSIASAAQASARAANEALIYGYLVNVEHFTPAGAAAADGNFQVESGWDPNAWNPNEQARGLAQWEGPRRTGSTGLQAYAAAHGGKETDLAMQLGYLSQELHGGYTNVLAAMRRATSPADAAAYWDQHFEGSSGSTRGARITDAQSIYAQVQQGKALTGGPSSSSPSVPSAATASGIYVDGNGVVHGTVGGNASNPLDAFSGIMADVKTLVIKSSFAAAGLALVVVGGALAAKKVSPY